MVDNARRSEGPSLDRGRRGLAAAIVRSGMILALFAILVVRAIADEPLDAPLPDITPQELMNKLRDAGRGADRGLLEVSFAVEDYQNGPDGIPIAVMEENPKTVLVEYSGRFRFLSEGRRWQIEYVGQVAGASLKLFPESWTAGFDGEMHYDLDVGRERAVLGDTRKDRVKYTPGGLFWPEVNAVIDWLDDPETIIGQRTVDGARCYVVSRGDGKYSAEEAVISPRQSYLLVEKTESREGKVVASHRLLELRRDARGRWSPGRIVIESRRFPFRPVPPPPDFLGPGNGDVPKLPEPPPLLPGPLPLEERRILKVVSYDPDRAIPPGDFSVRVPYGATVEDHRTGFAYVNDPWWPEVQAMLKERFADWFEWPIVDMSPLRQLAPSQAFVPGMPDGGIVGKGAPALRADLWINSGPLDWAKLKGKVTLVKFWALDRGTWSLDSDGKQHAALRKLYELYHPAGFEIIAIHEKTDDPESVRQFARELRLPYPIAIDSMAEGKDRTMSAAFNDGNAYRQAFLVDAAGKVHAIPDGKLVETLVELMKKAGARGVSTDMVDEYRLPQEALWHIHNTLPRKARDAHGNLKLAGTVKTQQRRPIADVQVRATLRVEVQVTPSRGYQFHVDDPTPWTTRTGPDGRFEIAGLSKGKYKLEVIAPGKAAVDRWVVIAPDLRAEPVDLVVDRPDGIAGFVRVGKRGWRLPVTLLILMERHQANGVVTLSTSGLRIFPTNVWGGFEFEGLAEGKYRLVAIGPGGIAGEYIEVGNRDATIRIRPWWSATP
jgi:peroxiredoxin